MRKYALLATLAETAVRAVALTRFDQGRETKRFEVDIGEPHKTRCGSKTALRMEESHAGLACVLSISGRINSGDAAILRELFEMSGLLEVFNIHGTREEALAQLG
jgi:hypothetical protein